ncbi:GerA spore germination protein [Alkaliphilus metalliredigens QYMF]|uniref:GerA spore germination protein n=1 Tax=Alkaliphilus metalliredigens (strain QYMF) TaxID=293826 RepID=A6TMS2_ALKMQ|nr:spore germination protein [Alkaliphilus metalliredigens]ABR47490.1 GerA spore germination protein [Alkaliphilus metalliredigens QYMF]
MFRKIMNFIKYMKYSPQNAPYPKPKVDKVMEKIPSDINVIRRHIEKIGHETGGVIIKPFVIHHNHTEALMVYIDGMADTASVEFHVLRPLMSKKIKESAGEKVDEDISSNLLKEIITAANSFTIDSMNVAMEYLFEGNALVFIEDTSQAIVIDAKGWAIRPVEEPQTDTVIRGPREGFVEDLQTNIALLRRKFKSPKLRFESMFVGRYSRTEINICYISGKADEEMLKEMRRRIARIDIDAVLDSAYIEQYIEDSPLSLFPLVGSTEKPDIVLGKILEGRIAILCDGSPFVLTAPQLFIEQIQSGADYYRRNVFSFTIRALRLLALFITTTLPAVYVAAQSFHHEFIPFELFISMAASREGLPFSSFIEALLMIIIFELIKEAGIRMPKPIGQAVSIVGAVVLGQAAVEANITSPLMVIVVALTAISGFIVPSLDETNTFIRLFLLVTANFLGFYGLAFAVMILVIYMCNLKSFGINYLSPLAPISLSHLTDTYARLPLWVIFKDKKSLFQQHKK